MCLKVVTKLIKTAKMLKHNLWSDMVFAVVVDTVLLVFRVCFAGFNAGLEVTRASFDRFMTVL